MNPFVDRLTAMFSKIIAGTVSREEGAILINHLVKENSIETISALTYLIENPPRNVFQKTVLHTIALARNKALFKIMAESIHSQDEDVSFLAASELARLRTEGAKTTLIENLDNEIYHVRKSAAMALAEDYGDDGLNVLKEHMLDHEEPFYRATSAQGLVCAGASGINTLFSILQTDKEGPVFSSAEALTGFEGEIKANLIPVAIEALMKAGDRRNIPLVVELLRLLALCNKEALKYEPFIAAFTDDNSESIRLEAQKTLHTIKRGR